MICPECNGDIQDSQNEHGFQCGTCSHPYPEEATNEV